MVKRQSPNPSMWFVFICFPFKKCFSTVIFVFIWGECHIMYPIILTSQSLQVHFPLLRPPPQNNNKNNKQKTHIQIMLPMYSLEHGQTPSSQTLKENWVLPLLCSCENPSAVETYSSASLSQFLSVVFSSFLSSLLFWGSRGWGWR